jgi:hypothetical protein
VQAENGQRKIKHGSTKVKEKLGFNFSISMTSPVFK